MEAKRMFPGWPVIYIASDSPDLQVYKNLREICQIAKERSGEFLRSRIHVCTAVESSKDSSRKRRYDAAEAEPFGECKRNKGKAEDDDNLRLREGTCRHAVGPVWRAHPSQDGRRDSHDSKTDQGCPYKGKDGQKAPANDAPKVGGAAASAGREEPEENDGDCIVNDCLAVDNCPQLWIHTLFHKDCQRCDRIDC